MRAGNGTVNMVAGANVAPAALVLDETGQVVQTLKALEFEIGAQNVQKGAILKHMAINLKYGVDHGIVHQGLEMPREGALILVGGGPSLKDNVEKIRKLRENQNNRIVCMNDSMTFLLDNGITPDVNVYWEVDTPEKAKHFQTPRDDVKYFIASQAHPSVFEMVAGKKVFMWSIYHGFEDRSDIDLVKEFYPQAFMSGGGIGGILRWLTTGEGMGFREFHVFGMDSSFTKGGKSHAYYDRKYPDCREVFCAGQYFYANAYLIWQAYDFAWQVPAMDRRRLKVVIYGEGLIPHMARRLNLHEESWRSRQ